MKKNIIVSKAVPGNGSQELAAFSTTSFRKENKKRILPDAFYPRWELEILSSFVAIFILWILPDWVNDTNNLLLSKFNVEIHSTWLQFACILLMVGFIISFILRIIWLSLVWKWHSNRSSHGDEMFKNLPSREMRIQASGTQKLASILDGVAELVFFISSIIFFLTVLGFVIQVLGSLLNHSISKTQEIQQVK